jgi:hypothetical protein
MKCKESVLLERLRASRNNARNAGKNCGLANLNRPARRREGRPKSKVVLCLIKYHTMKEGIWISQCIAPRSLNFGSSCNGSGSAAWGLQMYRILKSVVCSFGLESVRLAGDSMLDPYCGIWE